MNEEGVPALPDVDELLSNSKDDLINTFVTFIETHFSDEITAIMLHPDETAHHGLSIPFLDLLEDNLTLAHLLHANPTKLLPLLDFAIEEYQRKLLKSVEESGEEDDKRRLYKLKENCHARICHLMPNCPDTTKTMLPRASDIGTFIEVRGTVIRTGAIKVLEWERRMECSRCKHQFLIHADPEQGNAFPKVSKCPSEREPSCNSRNFRQISDEESICRDYQEIKIQEQIQHLTVGSIPRSMLVILENDLVDNCKAGDDVTVNGVVMRRWRYLQEGERCDLEMFILANHVRVNNQQRLGVTITDEVRSEFEAFWSEHRDTPITARNIILQSVCPQIYGMHLVKLAVALVLIGGVQKSEGNGIKVRGESHLLLVGDPGTGKSQFLKYAAKLSPRSVLTTGIGTTSAGLTVAAVKDQGGEWMLEAGALVLADGGVCCIDEFSSIRSGDKATIHEAMEQQTLSVAKAGLVCKLRTETTVIAATNPKIKYDKEQSLSVNTALASPLLSRFDLILVLLDEQNEDWDRVVSRFILQSTKVKGEFEDECWSLQKLQAYISHVSKTFTPVLTSDAERVLTTYYKKQRQADARNAARTTVRLLESLIRLAQAHSRLMYREEVTVQDAVVAIQLVEISMQNSAMLGVSSALHSAFPTEPEANYYEMERNMLVLLGLGDMVNDTVGVPSDNPKVKEEEGPREGATPYSQLSAFSLQRRAKVNGSQSSTPGNTGKSMDPSSTSHHSFPSSFSTRPSPKKEDKLNVVHQEEGEEEEEEGGVGAAVQMEGEEEEMEEKEKEKENEDIYDIQDSEDILDTNADVYPVGKPVSRRKRKKPASPLRTPANGQADTKQSEMLNGHVAKKPRMTEMMDDDDDDDNRHYDAPQCADENEEDAFGQARDEENGEWMVEEGNQAIAPTMAGYVETDDAVANADDEHAFEGATVPVEEEVTDFPFDEDEEGMMMVLEEEEEEKPEEEEDDTHLLAAKKNRKRFLD